MAEIFWRVFLKSVLALLFVARRNEDGNVQISVGLKNRDKKLSIGISFFSFLKSVGQKLNLFCRLACRCLTVKYSCFL